MIRFERRPTPSRVWTALTPVLAVALTMVAGGILFAMLGVDPFRAIQMIFWEPLFSERFGAFSRPQLLVKAGPLILIAVGLAIGFRANVWNIGAEGQYLIGALCAAAVALHFWPAPGWYVFPLMVLAGAAGGFAWAMIPALLRTKFRANEILVSLLLVYVAEKIVANMAMGRLRNPDGGGLPGSRNIAQYPAASNPELIAGTGMHLGVVAAFIAVIFAYVLLFRHIRGYEVQLAGQAPRAARFAGVDPNRLILFCLGLSGAMAGLAGMFELAGPQQRLNIDFGSGYGFTAIIVAFLGRLHPVGILAAGLLLALTYIGGELAQFMLRLPASSIQVVQGMLLFFLLALDFLSNYRIRFGRRGIA
jgi:general nucleoside transport system permease protein